jgi:hypothetical protein
MYLSQICRRRRPSSTAPHSRQPPVPARTFRPAGAERPRVSPDASLLAPFPPESNLPGAPGRRPGRTHGVPEILPESHSDSNQGALRF